MTVPAVLATTPQWIVVLLVWDQLKGKYNKIPVDHRRSAPCDAHDTAAHADYATAVAAAAKLGQGFTVGFVLTTRDDFFCVDIDHALDPATGQWSELAQNIMRSLPGCMIERSLSGTGLHVWGRYPSPPPHRKKRVDLGVECYTELRFIAIGTDQVGDIAPRCDAFLPFLTQNFPPVEASAHAVPDDGPRADWAGPADDADLVRRARQSRSGNAAFGIKASFEDLWTANVDVLSRVFPPDPGSHDPFDRSHADAALAQHLAFWTGCDVERIERLMRQSALVRDKWDNRADYLVARTIVGACGRQVQVLQDKPLEAGPAATTPPAAPTPVPPAAPAPLAPAAAPAAAVEGPPPIVEVQGHTYASVEDQKRLFAGCVYVLDQHRILVPGGHLLNPDRFRAHFGGYTFQIDDRNSKVTRNAWEAFTESQVLRPPRVEGTCFRPTLPYGQVLTENGRRKVNVYWPPTVDARPGDCGPFWRHMALLLPNERDRLILFYYLCSLVQFPGIKFQWAPLLQGVEGNGKTFISRCAAFAVGTQYVHWPKADKLGGQFNGWLFGKILYCVEDIGLGDRTEILEQLKPMIAGGGYLEIERKGIDQTTEEICGNFIFNSNHKNALRKTLNDRRYAILFCAQQSADDLRRDGLDDDYMQALYRWAREGGFAHVAYLLKTTPVPDEFNPATHCTRAPRTSSTDEAIRESYGSIEQEVQDAVESEEPGFRGGWISSGAFDRLLVKIGKDRYVSRSGRRTMLQNMGYDWHPALRDTAGRVNNPVLPDAAKVKLFVRKDRDDLLRITRPADVAAAYTYAQGVPMPAAVR